MDELRQMLAAEEAEEARTRAIIKKAQEEADSQRKAELEAEEARIQTGVEERRLKAEGELKDRLRVAFMSNPAATEADFEKAWPELRQRALTEETLKRDAEARASQAGMYRDAW